MVGLRLEDGEDAERGRRVVVGMAPAVFGGAVEDVDTFLAV